MRAWICTHLHGERRPVFVTISDSEVPLADAIASYLFNSQLVCTADGAMRLIVAQESRDHAGVWRAIESMVADDRNPIAAAEVFDLRQSMRNGGGPARSEEHTSELRSLMRISYAVFCLKKKKKK